MSEFFDVRDWKGERTGDVKERSLAHRDGDIHGTAHVWIFRRREDGTAQVLLQKRSSKKESYPGCYDTSSAGHLSAGDDYLPAALRELREELGLLAQPEELHCLGLFAHVTEAVFWGKPFVDREISMIYVYERDVRPEELKLQPEEVDGVLWMDVGECASLLEAKDERFCAEAEEFRAVSRYIETEVGAMEEKDRKRLEQPAPRTEPEGSEAEKDALSPTWNEDCLTELDDWIESQGIYIRQ